MNTHLCYAKNTKCDIIKTCFLKWNTCIYFTYRHRIKIQNKMKRSNSFEITWGCINDYRLFHFWLNYCFNLNGLESKLKPPIQSMCKSALRFSLIFFEMYSLHNSDLLETFIWSEHIQHHTLNRMQKGLYKWETEEVKVKKVPITCTLVWDTQHFKPFSGSYHVLLVKQPQSKKKKPRQQRNVQRVPLWPYKLISCCIIFLIFSSGQWKWSHKVKIYMSAQTWQAQVWSNREEPHHVGPRWVVKGIVHPKMKMLSSFTHPHVAPNLYEFLFYVKHERRYFEEFLNSCWSPLTSIVGKEILWKSMGTINCLITSILPNICFCVQHKKETHTGLEQHVNDDNIFIFGRTISLNHTRYISSVYMCTICVGTVVGELCKANLISHKGPPALRQTATCGVRPVRPLSLHWHWHDYVDVTSWVAQSARPCLNLCQHSANICPSVHLRHWRLSHSPAAI